MVQEPKAPKPEDISGASQAEMDPVRNSIDGRLRAALATDVAWLMWRAEFRKKVVASGLLRAPWRSVFEADMIFSIIGHRWLTGSAITLKELATYFEEFATEATVSRHVDDMQHAGLLIRRPDPKDRRRLLLIPTQRLEVVGREFLEARVRILQEHGFRWLEAEIDRKTATD